VRTQATSSEGHRRMRHLPFGQDEPKLAHVTVDSSYVQGIIERGMRECGYYDIKSFLREKVSNKSDRTLYRNLVDRTKTTMNVGALKRFCDRFKISPDEIERRGVILQPHPYPIDMKCRGFLKMKTHALNEGTITQKRLLSHSNQDPVMLKHFADTVKESGDRVLRKSS